MREQVPVRSEVLAAVADEARVLPRGGDSFGWWQKNKRLEGVYGCVGRRARWLALGMLPLIGGLAFAAQGLATWPIAPGVLLSALLFTVGIALPAPSRTDERALAREPFAVNGFVDWLLSREPLFDVRFRAALDPRRFATAVTAVCPHAAISWLDERTARIALPPRAATVFRAGTGDVSLPVADRDAFVTLLGRLIVPLHGEIGVESIEMGGYT